MTLAKILVCVSLATTFNLFAPTGCLLAAEVAPSSPGAPQRPNTPPAGPGGPRGFGRGGRGAPMTAEDQAAIARLADLPVWKPGVGVGDYVTSPPYAPASENAERDGVPRGKVVTFQMDMADSKFYPPTPGRGGALPGPREVNVYIPAQYVPGTPAPLLFCHDAMGMHDRNPAPYLPTILDNLIAEKRLPVMVAVMVMPSNQRSLE